MRIVPTLTAIVILVSCMVPTAVVKADEAAADDQVVADDQVAADDDAAYDDAVAADDQVAADDDAAYDDAVAAYDDAVAADDDQVAAYDDQVAADDDAAYDDAVAAYDDAVAADDAVEAYEEAEEDEEDDDDAYKYAGFTVCKNTAIQVTDVQFYCDSPGTFYYGSGKYRNSQNCTQGDKGRFVVDFYINDAEEIQATGGYPVVDVSATGNIGWYETDETVFENEDLCSISSLKSLSGAKCPAAGKYRIKSHFFWGEDTNYAGSFDPTLTVGFKSSIYENTYDYGGANTPYCSGTTFFTSWRNNVKKVYANSLGNFFKTFGILFFTILAMISFIWLMVSKPTSLQDARTKIVAIPRRLRRPPATNYADDDSSYAGSDDFDFNKMKSPRGHQSFLDF